MLKRITLALGIVFFAFISGYSQKDFREGFIVTNERDLFSELAL